MKSFNVFIVSALLLLISFLSVGYASLTDTLTVGADVNATWIEPNILYTSAASVTSGSADINYRLGSEDVANPAAHLTAELDFSSSETVQITLAIKNNFSVGQVTADFVFKGLYVEVDSEDGLVSYDKCSELTIAYEGITAEIKESGNNVDGTSIASGATLDGIKLTVTRKNGAPNNIYAMFSFKFGYESPDVVNKITADVALNQFGNSLNSDKKYIYKDKNGNDAEGTAVDYVLNEMEKNTQTTWGQTWGGDYVGNVTGGTSSDTTLIQALFGDTLDKIILEGDNPTKCTVIIKKKQVDGDTTTGEDGNELVVILTPNDIVGGEYTTEDNWNKVTAYAAVFTKAAGGDWVQIGETYTGIAHANNYETAHNGTPNSIDTESWVATLPYYKTAAEAETYTESLTFSRSGNGWTGYQYNSNGDSIEEVIEAYMTTDPNGYAQDLAASTANTAQ